MGINTYFILKYSTKHSLWKECWHHIIFRHSFSSLNLSNQIGHSIWPYVTPTCFASTFSVPFKNNETLSSTLTSWGVFGKMLLMTFITMQNPNQREKIAANMHSTKTIIMCMLTEWIEDSLVPPCESVFESIWESSLSPARKRFEFSLIVTFSKIFSDLPIFDI